MVNNSLPASHLTAVIHTIYIFVTLPSYQFHWTYPASLHHQHCLSPSPPLCFVRFLRLNGLYSYLQPSTALVYIIETRAFLLRIDARL